MNRLINFLATLAPGSSAREGGPARPKQRLSADLDCAAHYAFASSVDAPNQEAYRARFGAAIEAHLAANPPAPGANAGDDAEPAWRAAVTQRMEALGAPVAEAGRRTDTDRDRQSALATEFTRIWDGVRACDVRYGLPHRPAPFTWID